MKYSFVLILLGALFIFTSCGNESEKEANQTDEHAHHEHQPEDPGAKKPLSPRTNAMADIGDVHVHIDYSSPSVRGRTIWGGLVAYDQVWVTGAHSATSISFGQDIRVNGQIIPAGKYAFFTIPGREEWVAILNKNYDQHLADDYNEADDIMRMTILPEQLDNPVEALTYSVEPSGEKTGNVSVAWGKIKISFKIESL